MKLVVAFAKKAFFVSVALLIISYSALPALAAGNIEPVGTVGTIGPSGSVGPQGATGTIGEIGNQGDIGPTDPVGPQPEAPAENIDQLAADQISTPSTRPANPMIATIDTNADPAGVSIIAENSDTGPSSENSSSSTVNSETNIDVTNNSEINNQVDVEIDTGNNSLGSNTSAGNLTTGDIDSVVNILNLGNSILGSGSTLSSQTLTGGNNNLLILPSGQKISLDTSNKETGPSSDNSNIVNFNNALNAIIRNNATADNDINIDANTGNNTIANNTSIGDFVTGDIKLGINLFNLLNVIMPNTTFTIDTWSILGSLGGNLILDGAESNNQTGPNSSNTNDLNVNNQTNISVTENADISNQLDYNLNTGHNDIGSNTSVGDITTGDSIVKSAVTNIANIGSPIFYLINVFGKWTGSLLGLDPNQVVVNQINDTTGPGSTNNNSTDINSQTDVSIVNDASANNNIHINANTGNNTISNNTEVGNIKTGGIELTTNVVNILNTFSNKLGSITLRIIDIFGDWNGNGCPTDDGGKGGDNGEDPPPIVVPPTVVVIPVINPVINPVIALASPPISVDRGAGIPEPKIVLASTTKLTTLPSTGSGFPSGMIYALLLAAGGIFLLQTSRMIKDHRRKVSLDRVLSRSFKMH